MLSDVSARLQCLDRRVPREKHFSAGSPQATAVCGNFTLSACDRRIVVCVCRSDPAHRVANQHLVEQLSATYVSVPFDHAVAIDSAELRAHLAAAGQPIGPYDLLIAATARTHGLTLVTHNTAEFARVPGLLLEDWQMQ